MKVRTYIDGFNLYYGASACAKEEELSPNETAPSWKWLDVEALLQRLASAEWPGSSVERVEYFTARIKARYPRHQSPDRQDVYLRALSRRGIDVVYGHFLKKDKWRPLVARPNVRSSLKSRSPMMAWVEDSEEKGSDVNLATRLLVEHFREGNDFDAAIVVSNDSDLRMPVEVLRNDGRPVGIVNPHRSPVPALWPRGLPAPHFGRRIEMADLLACQLPDPLTTRSGDLILSRTGSQIRKPTEW